MNWLFPQRWIVYADFRKPEPTDRHFRFLSNAKSHQKRMQKINKSHSGLLNWVVYDKETKSNV